MGEFSLEAELSAEIERLEAALVAAHVEERYLREELDALYAELADAERRVDAANAEFAEAARGAL